MAEFSVRVVEVKEGMVDHHPDADRLSIIKIGGYICISAKLEDGSHRYKTGDMIVYVPEGAVVPENLLRNGFWNEEKGKGILAGTHGNRVKAMKLRGIFSQGILFPIVEDDRGLTVCDVKIAEGLGTDDFEVTRRLGITKYEPPIPAAMAGEVFSDVTLAVKYDFESVQRITDMFVPGELVDVTEKLHGTFFCLMYVPAFGHPDAFGRSKMFYVCSKGLGGKGLFFKDNEANKYNVYAKTARLIIEEHEDKTIAMGAACDGHDGSIVQIFGEIFGKGIQDLHYGYDNPQFRVFDVRVGAEWAGPGGVKAVAETIGVQKVPELYLGPYDEKVLMELRDGKDTISSKNVREGIVIRGVENERHELHGRKIAKWVSPDYLLRKGEVTEFA